MWLVIHIGCIECDVPTKALGLFSNMEKAYEVAEACDKLHGGGAGGHAKAEVFDLPPVDVVDADYMTPNSWRMERVDGVLQRVAHKKL